MPATRSGGVSRTVFHDNTINRKHDHVHDFQPKHIVRTPKSLKFKRPITGYKPTPKKKKQVDIEDAVKDQTPKKVEN